jgi:chemotaxis protein MotA
MFAIIGIIIVFGAVLGGYLMEHGNVKVLLQPAELIIIAGAAGGTVLIANPLHVLKQIIGGVIGVFKGSPFTAVRYLASLKLAYQLLNKARRQGLMSLETDIEDPANSAIFQQDAAFLASSHIKDFFCDSMRMAISGVDAFELDQLIELDLEVLHHDATLPITSLNTVADSLPGLGIVAAVLGVVITMGALGGPPERNRPQSRGGTRRYISWHSALLRLDRPIGRQHGEDRRRRKSLHECAARSYHFIPEGHRTHSGG